MAHWLLIVGSVLVFASAFLKWVYFAFSRHPLGLQLPLLRNLELIPHLSLFSYGVVGIAVLNDRSRFALAFRHISRARCGRHSHRIVDGSAMPDCFSAAEFAWSTHC